LSIQRFGLFFFLWALTTLSFAQGRISQNQRTRILFILDASGSMNDEWSNVRKFGTAKQIILQMLDSVKNDRNIEVALRVFGHQSEKALKNCEDTKLEVPFSYQSLIQIPIKLEELEPKGYTPIGLSLSEAVNDFQNNGNIKNIIIMLTDGIENCEGDICQSAQELISKGISFKPYIVGLGLDKFQTKSFECAGRVFNIEEESKARLITGVVISTALNPTSLQINLIDAYGVNSQTDIPITFYDLFSKKLKYNMIHAMASSNTPDSLFFPFDEGYALKIHSLPSIEKDSVVLNRGKHNISAIDLSTGQLKVSSENLLRYKNTQFIVRKAGESTILNVQGINTAVNYQIGKYDVTALSTPPMYFKDVEVVTNKETKLFMPVPGAVNISSSRPGFVYVFKQEGEHLDKVYEIISDATQTPFLLLPGDYVIQFREKTEVNSKNTRDKSFKLIPGGIVNVRF
jgi:Ca-activated chloride channel homolog